MYLKCWKNLFEIGLLLPLAEILGMENLGMEQDLELTLKLNLELLESFSVQTYHPSAGTVAAADAVVLEVCILLGALSHRRNLLLSERSQNTVLLVATQAVYKAPHSTV